MIVDILQHIDILYTINRYGRRRPFIFIFSIILVLSLLLLYVGQSLGAAADQDAATKQLRMLLLAVGVILLDYASQAAINPCEALVSDLMAGQPGEAGGFTVRTLYIILFIYLLPHPYTFTHDSFAVGGNYVITKCYFAECM